MKITIVGIDLAKNVFQVHGIDEHGKAVLKKQLRRDQMAAFFVNLPQYIKEPYRRFLENNIRDHWDFSGVPMQIYFRQK